MRADARFRLELVVQAQLPSRAPSEWRTDRFVTVWCRSRLLPCAALLLTALASAACTTGGIPILAPGEAKLGATALVFVDTNGIPNGDLYEHYDLSRDNVTLGIEDAAGVQVFAPRAVVGFQDLRTAETVPNDLLKGAGRQIFAAVFANPQAHPTAEATNTLAMVDPIDATSARVLLVEPSGFALRDADPSNTPIGTGPFLDVVFAKTGPFETGEFAIEDLVATDRDGNELLREPGDATALFQLLAVRNQ